MDEECKSTGYPDGLGVDGRAVPGLAGLSAQGGTEPGLKSRAEAHPTTVATVRLSLAWDINSSIRRRGPGGWGRLLKRVGGRGCERLVSASLALLAIFANTGTG